MKHHGMLFKAEMVRARQDGRKTMTRRNITFANSVTEPHVKRDEWKELRWEEAKLKGHHELRIAWAVPFRNHIVRVYPRIQPGDVIWVKETWCPVIYPNLRPGPDTHIGLHKGQPVQEIYYRADKDKGYDELPPCWHSSMLMPRWASRTDLDVIKVGSERVQEISEADAKAEGAVIGKYYKGAHREPLNHRDAFHDLWDSINAAKDFGWEVNHPVWIYEWSAAKK
jgi:hypothetical protein